MEYQISLQVFEGPLDLLLHLIEEKELEISAVSLTGIIQQYLAYLQQLQQLDFEMMSSFLIITMELIDLKRRSLLPEEIPVSHEEEVDLVTILKEYQVFHLAASSLQELQAQQEQIFQRPWAFLDFTEPAEHTLSPPSLAGLREAYEQGTAIQKRKGKPEIYLPLQETCTIEGQMQFLQEKTNAEDICFYRLCRDLTSLDFIVTFLSLLELVRRGEVGVKNRGGRLLIYARG